ERKHVIPVDALFDGRIDLDRVLHAEQAIDAVALPYQRVERRHERASVHRLRDAHARTDVRRFAPAFDTDGNQPPFVNELGDETFCDRLRAPFRSFLPPWTRWSPIVPAVGLEVADDVAKRADAVRPCGQADQLLHRLFARW